MSPDRGRATVQHFLVYALAGPLAGLGGMSVVVGAAALLDQRPLDALAAIFFGAIVGVVFAFLFGLLPALITAGLVLVLRRRFATTPEWLLGGAAGLVVTTVCIASAVGDAEAMGMDQRVALLIGPFGGFAGATCGWLNSRARN